MKDQEYFQEKAQHEKNLKVLDLAKEIKRKVVFIGKQGKRKLINKTNKRGRYI